ncbi:type II secretion system F family protein [Bacillus sp. V5-8f]|uniref:type II secretion system F family protein n=1 Tax=Bacillus sp. V5-8f TaxID=2053044 RepID=UPI000C760C4B|nr:type II secretion system F family protein [Bacillus sp. V5-8f]PLT32390.1 type II secretion system F family protein [Bacillus sp. V5-8f]
MPVFQYQGRNKTGKRKSGKVMAENRKEAVLRLRESGVSVISINELNGILYKEISLGGKKVKNKDFIIYLRQFSTLLKAGVPIVEATKILAQQTSSKVLKKTLAAVVQNLEEGKPYSDAAEEQNGAFPPLFTNMVRAGEAGGNLDEILERMAVYFEKQYRTRQKVKSAMMYPATVGIISIVIVIFLLSTVVPAFAGMFATFGGELPLITRIVMSLGSFFGSYWWVFLLLAIAVYIGVYLLISNRKTKYFLDYVLLKLPLFGSLLQKAQIARMTRTLSSLFSSSVPILQSIMIVERILGNEVLSKVLREARTSIEKGQSMAVPMEIHWAFPPMVTQMIAIGEKSGTLDSMLDRVADFYEMEVDNSTDQIKSLIEPMMIVFLAFVVGGIVGAIAVPMFSIFETIN